jgi:hypothetical protein
MSLKSLVGGALLGGGALYFAQQYHVVQHADGLELIARTQAPSLASSYLDVRGWGPSEWAEYPDVTAALVQAERVDLIYGGAVDGAVDSVTQPFGQPGGATGGPALTSPPVIHLDPELSSTSAAMTRTTSPSTVADDDSLIGRLSRQLQQQSATPAPQQAPPPERVREPATNRPAQPFVDSPLPQGQDRAAIDTPATEDAWTPSIHSTGLERIIGADDVAGADSAAAIAARQTEDFFSTLQSRLPLEPGASAQTGASTTAPPQAEPANWQLAPPLSAAPVTIPLENLQLGSQLPGGLQEQLRSLVPGPAGDELPGWFEPL